MQPAKYMARVFVLAGFVLVLCAGGSAAREAAGQAAQGESAQRGRMLGFTCGELPKDAAFEVTPFGDSSLDRAMARAFAAELRKKDHAVKSGERYEVTLESHIARGVIEAPSRSLGRLKIKNRGVEVRFNVWSSGEDSLLVRRPRGKARETTHLTVTARLRDRQAGKGLWTGEAIAELRGATPLAVGRALMPALVEAFDCSLNLDGVPGSKD